MSTTTITSVEEARVQVDKFVQSNQSMNEYFITIFKRLQDELAKNNELENDLKNEKMSRRTYQQEAEQFKHQVIKYEREAEELTTKNPFVVLLVDGDGAKFRDDFLNQPDLVAAADKAANNLKKAIRDHIRQESLDEDATIIVRVFANLSGLAKALKESNVISSPDRMYKFAENFTNSCPDFDFINVGWGKENADSKVRRNLAHYYNINQCKRIFLAGCHDNGYLHELKLYTDRPEKKIVLVETTPAEHGFKIIGFPITNFDTVFRSEPLDNETKRVPAKAVKTSPTTEKAVPKPSQVKTLPPALTPTSPTGEGDVGSESDKKPIWTDVVRKEGHENVTNKTSQSKEQTNKFIYLNKEQCRIDSPVDKPSQYNNPAQESYRTKLEHAKAAGKNGFCNRHYLQQYCSYEEKCYADHETKLTREELAIMRFKARQRPCNYYQDCEDPTCPFAHHCPLSKEQCTKQLGGSDKCAHTLHFTDEQKRHCYKYMDGKLYQA